MEDNKKIEVVYDRARDILYLQTLPPRPARIAGFEFDFFIRYDWDDPAKIVGFEWLDFSTGYKGIDHIDEIKLIKIKFDIIGTTLRNLSLKQVFDWAFKTYVQGMLVLEEFDMVSKT